MEAKSYKITKVNAVDSGINVTFPLNYLITQDNKTAAYTKTEEFAQKIAAALNFFDTVMASLASINEAKESPDKFSEYIIAGSWISKVGYDYNKNKLRIWKNDESFFTHLNVPVEVWDAFISANSVGGWYNSNIRGKYERQ